MSTRFRGFAPIGSESPRILVLGSFPSRRSLEKGEYYGHERNHFWAIMGALRGFDPLAGYAERIAALERSGIGLWDVIASCEREGSMDGDIRNEEPNPIVEYLAARPTVERVALNGGKAASAFAACFAPENGKLRFPIGTTVPWRPAAMPDRLILVARLPSTSPIPTRDYRRAEDKLPLWSEFLAASR
jgi:hypoxanthine-DNA glycosylase